MLGTVLCRSCTLFIEAECLRQTLSWLMWLSYCGDPVSASRGWDHRQATRPCQTQLLVSGCPSSGPPKCINH